MTNGVDLPAMPWPVPACDPESASPPGVISPLRAIGVSCVGGNEELGNGRADAIPAPAVGPRHVINSTSAELCRLVPKRRPSTSGGDFSAEIRRRRIAQLTFSTFWSK